MENPLRIGNDANFEWSVKKIVGDEKVPYDLTGRNLQLFLVGRVDRIEVTDFVVNGNVIMWTFYGKDQRHTGIYNALLVENMGEERMVTVDIQYAVTLVPHSWIITGEDGDGCGCVTMDTIYLESAFTMEPGPRGYSAYEVAVQQGYVGTVDEWLESLVGFSPSASVTKEGDTATITITDREGTTTATVRDGSDADVTRENIEEALGGAPVMTETDPNVPDWAKAANKPSYTANEVGALPDDTPIPSALSDLSDVASTAPSDGQALIWDNTAGTWKPGAAGSPDAVKYVSQSLTGEQQAQARTNIGATAPELFVATYGTTTQSEVLAAVSAGKAVICFYNNRVYTYAGESAAGCSQFTSIVYNTAFRVYLKNSTWGSASLDIPTDVVKYTAQSLTDAQKTQARDNIGAGTYDKPSGGIPSSDMASAVQTSLGKADTAYQKPANGIPGSDLAPGAVPQEVFWATKDVTTYNDIVAANNAGKVVLVYYSNRVYFLANIASSQARFATPFISASAYALSVNSSGSWSSSSSSYEKSTNKVDTIVGNESDTNKYPSAKGVADYIASKELSDLADVSDTAPTDGQALIWDDTNEEWKPGTVQGGGSVTDVTVGGTSVVNQQGVAEIPEIPEAVQYVSQTLTDTQKAQARTNIGAGTYSKPSGGIPASDLASGVIPDVSGKEDKNNKVTSFGSTPSDAKYPSEKLVKDSLDTKQPTIDASHKLDYSLLSNTPTIPTVESLTTSEIDTIWNTAMA